MCSQEQCSRSACEVNKLKEQVRQLQEECKVARNNARSAVDSLEYQLARAMEERAALGQELHEQREAVKELQVQCLCHQEDKAQLKGVLSETQKHVVQVERELMEVERRYREERRLRQEEVSTHTHTHTSHAGFEREGSACQGVPKLTQGLT